MKLIFFLILVFSLGGMVNSEEKDVFTSLRENMVRQQIERRGVTDTKVLEAMKNVERHLFVPEEIQSFAYMDRPLPIEEEQTISQPYIVALMTELLQLKGVERVLEIGTGSGYQAAVLGEIAKEVYTIEIFESLAQSSKELLDELGYTNVKVKCGDGFLGWPEFAPFDAIMVTCAPEEIPEPLLEQLAEGGRLVIPVGTIDHRLSFQELKLIEKTGGEIRTQSISKVRFVPMLREAEMQ